MLENRIIHTVTRMIHIIWYTFSKKNNICFFFPVTSYFHFLCHHQHLLATGLVTKDGQLITLVEGFKDKSYDLGFSLVLYLFIILCHLVVIICFEFIYIYI